MQQMREQINQRLFSEWVRESITFKIVSIGVLILILMIPTAQIKGLIIERQIRRDVTVTETSSQWGKTQTIRGPILSIPYMTFKEEEGRVDGKKVIRKVEERSTAYFLPQDLEIGGHVDTQSRRRGIYELITYNSKLETNGNFVLDLEQLNVKEDDVLWEGAALSFYVSDMTGIKDKINVAWNKEDLLFEPGGVGSDSLGVISEPFPLNKHIDDFRLPVPGPAIAVRSDSSVSVQIPLDRNVDSYQFDMNVDLNGSGGLRFTPIGRETRVTLSSNWESPSFSGRFLPDNRTLDRNGFNAEWKVLNFNREYPQQWVGGSSDVSLKMDQSDFGVTFYQPVDMYQRTMRSVKYSLMFIFLTFLVFFFVEVLNKKKIHPIQYLLGGVAISLFYLLLLSLSEHMQFHYAYLLASIGTILVITGYVRSMFRDTKVTATIGAILAALYVFLYIALSLEDYALLVGSIGLFVALVVTMYVSRNVDWYSITMDKS